MFLIFRFSHDSRPPKVAPSWGMIYDTYSYQVVSSFSSDPTRLMKDSKLERELARQIDMGASAT